MCFSHLAVSQFERQSRDLGTRLITKATRLITVWRVKSGHLTVVAVLCYSFPWSERVIGMSLRAKYLRILSGIAPAGAAGIALLLGSTMPGTAARLSTSGEPLAADGAGVGERLAAIREAVSDLAKGESTAAQSEDNELHLAWGNWWRNWGWRPRGWGWPNWNNWRNWHPWNNWWRNW